MDDTVYYADGLKRPFAGRVLHAARSRMHELFLREMQPAPADTILDIGVSTDENEHSNFLEKLYPHRHMITAAGIGAPEAFLAAFPDCRYVRIAPGAPLPFADQSFDIAYSNAVLEHVGDAARRKAFIAEARRVARRVFLLVPNRWFPVEHHTGLPFLHYAPGVFRRFLRGSRFDYWTYVDNLDFLSAGSLRREIGDGEGVRAFHTGIPLGPASSNVALVWDSPTPQR